MVFFVEVFVDVFCGEFEVVVVFDGEGLGWFYGCVVVVVIGMGMFW